MPREGEPIIEKYRIQEFELLADPKAARLGLSPVPIWAPMFLREACCQTLRGLIEAPEHCIVEFGLHEWVLLHYRLVHYPDIKRAWHTVMHGPQKGEASRQDNPEEVGIYFYQAMLEKHEYFDVLPKRNKTARNKNFVRAAELCDKLVDLIREDFTVGGQLNSAVRNYIGDRALDLAKERGTNIPGYQESEPWTALINLPLALGKYAQLIDPTKSLVPAENWSSWFYQQAMSADLDNVLSAASSRLREACSDDIEISQPGRPDNGYLPYMIGSISSYIKWLHGQPFDEAVAIFASAMANLDTPLGRDDVRGRRREKISKK